MSDPNMAITIFQSSQLEALPAEDVETDILLSAEQAIGAWLDESYKRSQSTRTKDAYENTLKDFRAYLLRNGCDLDSPSKTVERHARAWVDTRSPLAEKSRRERPVSKNTYYQRLAILSSFYRFAVREEVNGIESNPIEKIKRDRQGSKAPARPLSEEEVKAGLSKIDRTTLEGKRDYALLQVALNTGHRASEIAGISLKHLTFVGDSCLIAWERVKGDKQMDPYALPPKPTKALRTYLEAVYGPGFLSLPAETPVWISFSVRNRDEAIGTRTISNICKAYLGTSKVHTTRHTAAKKLMDSGATLAQIGKFLGHSNLKTTSDYVEELAGYVNPHAHTLEEAFSLDD